MTTPTAHWKTRVALCLLTIANAVLCVSYSVIGGGVLMLRPTYYSGSTSSLLERIDWLFPLLMWVTANADDPRPVHDWMAATSILAVTSLGILLTLMLITRRTTTPNVRRSAIRTAVCALPLAFIAIDSPSVDPPYSVDDLPIPAEYAEESWEAFEGLLASEVEISDELLDLVPAYGPSRPEMTSIVARAEDIDRMWAGLAGARKAVANCDQYDFIADLPNPSQPLGSLYAWQGNDWDALRRLSRAYQLGALLFAARSEADDAAQVLGSFHRVLCKHLPFSRSLVARMQTSRGLGRTIETAAAIAEMPDCSADTLRMLLASFTPVARRDASLWPSLLYDELGRIHALSSELPNSEFVPFLRWHVDAWHSTRVPAPPSPAWYERASSWASALLVFKRNRTVADRFELLATRRTECDVYGDAMEDTARYMEWYNARPRVRNVGGWFVNAELSYSTIVAKTMLEQMKVKSDLLWLELNRRLDQSVSLNDPYTEQPYAWDANSLCFVSAGPDSDLGTADDIRLGK